jgi:hypothetical protein
MAVRLLDRMSMLRSLPIEDERQAQYWGALILRFAAARYDLDQQCCVCRHEENQEQPRQSPSAKRLRDGLHCDI